MNIKYFKMENIIKSIWGQNLSQNKKILCDVLYEPKSEKKMNEQKTKL